MPDHQVVRALFRQARVPGEHIGVARKSANLRALRSFPFSPMLSSTRRTDLPLRGRGVRTGFLRVFVMLSLVESFRKDFTNWNAMRLR